MVQKETEMREKLPMETTWIPTAFVWSGWSERGNLSGVDSWEKDNLTLLSLNGTHESIYFTFLSLYINVSPRFLSSGAPTNNIEVNISNSKEYYCCECRPGFNEQERCVRLKIYRQSLAKRPPSKNISSNLYGQRLKNRLFIYARWSKYDNTEYL